MDVYELGPGSPPKVTQVHDLNPSPSPPVGLFWTTEIPDNGVEVQLGRGYASVEAHNIPIIDYGDIGNAIFGGGPPGVPGHISYRVVWSGVDHRRNFKNTDPVYGGFAGNFVYNKAQMEWSARVGDNLFLSAPMGTSSSSFAVIGEERNGVFFP